MTLDKKLYKQQKQTRKFFELDASNWEKKSNVFKNKIFNTIQERNFYVIDQIKKYKLKSLVDIGCGSGDLCFEASKITDKSVGIDFSKNMIRIAKKNFKSKNLNFFHQNFFDCIPVEKFECLSANGFIEYISLDDINNFLKISKKFVKKNKYIIFGTRNRLFNLFSLNKFSSNELKRHSFKKFYEESIALSEMNFNKFIKLKKNKFEEVMFTQPKTGVNVDKRHQFSPLQIIDLLKKNKWKIIDFYPINYHPVIPINYMDSKESKLFSNFIYHLKQKNKLPYIPFSSSFMITAKNI